MNNLKNFKSFNEAFIYDEDFNEFLVKHLLSNTSEEREIWSLISDIIQIMKSSNDIDILTDFRNDLLHDNKDNYLKIAMQYALKVNAHEIYDQLSKYKNSKNIVKNILHLRVKNLLQAEDVKDVLEAKPWYNKVKIEGHNLFVDLKNNTIEEIKNLLINLPFEITVL